MGKMWRGWIAAAAVLAGLAGCHRADPLQPPKPKDEYALPPTDDPRFLGPPHYPNNLLNQDTMLKDKEEDDAQGHGPGSHAGMSGPGH